MPTGRNPHTRARARISDACVMLSKHRSFTLIISLNTLKTTTTKKSNQKKTQQPRSKKLNFPHFYFPAFRR